MELKHLAPSDLITFTATHPETLDEFAVQLLGPYSTAGDAAVQKLISGLADVDRDTERERSEAFVATILRGLPDVTVDGVPLTIRDAAHAREVIAAIPYVVPQVVTHYMERLSFLSERKRKSSLTSSISET